MSISTNLPSWDSKISPFKLFVDNSAMFSSDLTNLISTKPNNLLPHIMIFYMNMFCSLTWISIFCQQNHSNVVHMHINWLLISNMEDFRYMGDEFNLSDSSTQGNIFCLCAWKSNCWLALEIPQNWNCRKMQLYNCLHSSK